jgi:hypothetical protein
MTDIISRLPTEVLLKIFAEIQDFRTLRQVCKRWDQVVNDPQLWKALPFVQPLPRGTRPARARERCFRRFCGELPPAMQTVATLEDARTAPILAQWRGELYALYPFYSSFSQGVRFLNLTSGKEHTFKLDSRLRMGQVNLHHLGLDDELFWIVERPALGGQRSLTLTFLNRELRPTAVPELQLPHIAPGTLHSIAPFRQGAMRGVTVTSAIYHPRALELFHLQDGQWQSVARSTRSRDALFVQEEAGTELIELESPIFQRGSTLQATKYQDGKFQEVVWKRSIQRELPFFFRQLWSVKLKDENYVVISGESEIHLLPCRANEGENPGQEWSLQLPFELSSLHTTGAAFPIGKDHILIIEHAEPLQNWVKTSRWLLLANGQSKLLGWSRVDRVSFASGLGIFQTEGSLAEYYYNDATQQVRRLELLELGAPPGVKWSAVEVLTVLLSVYVTACHLRAVVRGLEEDWLTQFGLLATVVLMPAMGLGTGWLQDQSALDGMRWARWFHVVPFSIVAGCLLRWIWDDPIARNWCLWGLASSVAWNRTWPVVWKVWNQLKNEERLTIVQAPGPKRSGEFDERHL